jgi:putative glutamine amidotransferase
MKITSFKIISICTIIVMFLFVSCLQKPDHKALKIAISKAAPAEYYANYPLWLHIADTTIEMLNMYEYSMDSALALLATCDGLLLTGGPDVYPAWYGKEEDTARCGGFDKRRDTLEMKLIEKALQMKIPILGICRGEQIFNVYSGGSLIIDIPTDFDSSIVHRQTDGSYRCFHKVTIDSSSGLFRTSKAGIGIANSNHHQAIDQLADELKVTAFSDDNSPEAIEWKNPKGKSFFMAVQWHPERLEPDNPLSLPIALFYLKACEEYQSMVK